MMKIVVLLYFAIGLIVSFIRYAFDPSREDFGGDDAFTAGSLILIPAFVWPVIFLGLLAKGVLALLERILRGCRYK
jgi:hypothetical protein